MEGLVNADSEKRLLGILCVLSLLLVAFPNTNVCKATPGIETVETLQPRVDPDGRFEKVWVEHDVRVDGKKGMRIHSSFVVKNSLRAVCTLVAHFYNSQGAELPGADMQGDYSTSDGHVVTYVKFTPRFTSTRYADKTLFIPYKEFKIKAPGSYQLKFILFLERHDQGDRVLAKSEEFNFKYTKTSE